MPFDDTFASSSFTYSNGNRSALRNDTAWKSCILVDTIPVNDLIFYEIVTQISTSSLAFMIGIQSDPPDDSVFPGQTSGTCGFYSSDGNVYISGVPSSYGSSYELVVVGVATNSITGKIWFSLDNVWQNSGDPAAGTGEAASGIFASIPAVGIYAGGSKVTVNESLSQFVYSPPSGFYPLVAEAVYVNIEFNQSIASFITIPFVQRISMATRLYYGFQQILAQAKRANLEFAQTFDTATPIYFPFEFPIAGLQAVQIAFDQIFHGFGPPVALEFLQTWYSQGYDVAFLPFAHVIGSEVEAALQEIQFSVTVAGVRVGVSKCTFDRQGFANYANITLRERKDYNNKQSGDVVTLTLLGEPCTLMVVNKPFDEQLGQGSVERSYVLECISITSQLSEDFNDSLAASRINASYPAGTMASVILDDLTAGVCSYSLNVSDFQTGGFDFEDSERFSALRAVFPENYGWIISTNKAGVLQIGAFVVPYLGGSGHKSLYFERKSLIPPDGVLYNQVKLSNYNKEPGSQGTTGLRIEVVDNGNGTGTIYGYSVPWTPNFAIYDSEDATAPSLIIQGGGIEEVEVEDVNIEFIDYSAGLSKPIYSAPVFDWGGNDSLEPISYDEAGNLTTEQLNGYSVAANVTYITKRKVWTYDNSRTDITQVRIKYQ